MREALKNIFGKEIILEDGTCFLYTIQPYELKNMLGQTAAMLDEYTLTRKDSIETYKLYRTTDGNWYDIPEHITTNKNTTIRSLKLAILSNENTLTEK